MLRPLARTTYTLKVSILRSAAESVFFFFFIILDDRQSVVSPMEILCAKIVAAQSGVSKVLEDEYGENEREGFASWRAIQATTVLY